ncbi:MAG: flagellin [Myxococcota bacterium]|nr:flagellin [Myxococcota bacterium]
MTVSLVTNIASLRAQKNLRKTTDSLGQSIERLSSGLRINKAGDDPARSSIASQLGAHMLGMKQAQRNANDADSVVQVADGAMSELTGIITRMRELSVQASNDGTMDSTERGYLNQEFQLLESELDRIVQVTEFNGTKLINGALSAGTSFQVGFRNTANDRISMTITSSTSTQLGLNDDSLSAATAAQKAITALDTALESINTKRGTLGATQNRLTVTISNLGSLYENQGASLSRLQDADIAEESASFTRKQILTQAGTAVLAQANALPQTALALLV